MITHLAYGKTGIRVTLADDWAATVVEPRLLAGLPNPQRALREALRRPIASAALAERVQTGDRVGIVVNDITRATPSRAIVEAILAELPHVPRKDVTLFNALGTHRPNYEAELREMLGDELVDTCRMVQNDCFDRTTQVFLGEVSPGRPVWVNRELMDCDLRILTGFIEPHFFAGFSGGGKAIMPGMAGLETILNNHSAEHIRDPRATWGVTQGNPIWEEVQAVTAMAEPLFLVNVALNRSKEITAVFAGNLRAAHAQGCAFVKANAMVAVPAPFDVVLTSNSGYPLDLNLYQSVKGMSAAAQVVRPGGAIVIVSQCWDGVPDHGLYGQILREARSPQEVLMRIHQAAQPRQDQWQAQVQAQVQLKAQVFVHSSGLSDETVRQALLEPAPRLEETLHTLVARYGPRARLCVLPEGPTTIPYVTEAR
jgi:nickel-dependent lactate racemase